MVRALSLYFALAPLAAWLILVANGSRAGHLETGESVLRLHFSDGSTRDAHGAPGSNAPVLPVPVPFEKIPDSLIEAVLFQEDQAFYRHRGYSTREMYRALRDRLVRKRRLRGASTISQQLARTLFLDREGTVERKLTELRVALLMERRLGKDRILELYLNNVYWGRNRYGIQAAARQYFGKSAADLKPEESALLVALLPNPDACAQPPRCGGSIDFRKRRILKHLKNARRHPGLRVID